MAFYTYMLLCADGKYYVGHTDNLEARIGQHQSGMFGGYTLRRRPVELVWSEYFQTRLEALNVERQLKGWSKAKRRRWQLGIGIGFRNWRGTKMTERAAELSFDRLRTNGFLVNAFTT